MDIVASFRELSILLRMLTALPKKEREPHYLPFLNSFREYTKAYKTIEVYLKRKERARRRQDKLDIARDELTYKRFIRRFNIRRNALCAVVLAEAVRYEIQQEIASQPKHIGSDDEYSPPKRQGLIPTVTVLEEPEYISVGHLKFRVDF